MGACAGCELGKTADTPTLKCSACDLTRSVDCEHANIYPVTNAAVYRYCSKACQKEHWSEYKFFCKVPKSVKWVWPYVVALSRERKWWPFCRCKQPLSSPLRSQPAIIETKSVRRGTSWRDPPYPTQCFPGFFRQVLLLIAPYYHMCTTVLRLRWS